MKGISYSAFVYADDLILLSPSVSELQTMVNICCNELYSINLKLNTNKSYCLRVGRRCFSTCCDITADGEPISWVKDAKYLGITIMSGKTFKVSFAEARCKFYAAFNALYSKIGFVLDINVIIHLMEFIAVPILCYALESLNLSKTELSSLDFTYNRTLLKIFKVSNSNDLHFCTKMFNISNICEKYTKKKRNFENKMQNIDNAMINNLHLNIVCI